MKLSRADAEQRVKSLKGWTLEGDAIKKQYTFKDFPAAIAFVNRLYTRGGPYFARPVTIVDHVGPQKHETRDALILLPKVRPLLPRGAHVTCFEPGSSDLCRRACVESPPTRQSGRTALHAANVAATLQ